MSASTAPLTAPISASENNSLRFISDSIRTCPPRRDFKFIPFLWMRLHPCVSCCRQRRPLPRHCCAQNAPSLSFPAEPLSPHPDFDQEQFHRQPKLAADQGANTLL